jgi:hypothetical protein
MEVNEGSAGFVGPRSANPCFGERVDVVLPLRVDEQLLYLQPNCAGQAYTYLTMRPPVYSIGHSKMAYLNNGVEVVGIPKSYLSETGSCTNYEGVSQRLSVVTEAFDLGVRWMGPFTLR